MTEHLHYIPLVKEAQIPLLVWFAYRRNDRITEKLALNTDPPLTQNVGIPNKPFIDLDIQFVPMDKERRKYRLNVRSWGDLNLTERD